MRSIGKRGFWIGVAALLGAGAFTASALAATTAEPAAPFVATLASPWQGALPDGWVLGDVSAVEVDRKGQVYLLHRPATVRQADRAHAAPPILVFDRNGRFLRGLGGPGEGYDWPRIEHSLAVDRKGRIWISGNFRAKAEEADDQILVFDRNGRFLRQLGKRGASQGNADTANFGAPADIFVDDARREVYVADGYVNRRLIVLDSETGAFKRMWSAFGAPPPAEPGPTPRLPGRPFTPDEGDGPAGFNGVHGVEVARDGTVYVADRLNQRVQLFTRAGKYLGQVFVDRNFPSPTTASGLALSADRAQKYLYVADLGNNQFLVFDRARRQLVQRVTEGLAGPHLIASGPDGAIYVAEIQGRRVTKVTLRKR